MLEKKRTGLVMGVIGSLFLCLAATRRKNRPKSKAVLVLGNGRSGTSVLTRALNFMGVDLGNDKFLKPRKENPKGFFENETIINLHKKIGSKIRYRPASRGYEHSRKIQPYKEELRNYVQKQFIDTGKPVWGWKDPRTNDYLALWQDILHKLHVEPHYIIIIRNPIDVVASNKRAWNRDETWALRQWQVRTLLSLRDTYGGKRVIVSYEQLFHHPLECLRRIAQTVQLPWVKDEAKLQKQLDSFIDPHLQRSDSHSSLENFKRREDVSQDVKDLYLLALEGTRNQDYFQSRAFHRRVEKLYQDYLKHYGPLYRDPPKKDNA
ncbi:hypothetical protein EWH99_13250 [Sporolactobacillus sp. THM7-7]|nr:hypothetical protein EWH99_13250 [Sporolactobacillus sp. THM7-7]